MQLPIDIKKLHKDRVFALISFIAGLVFLSGIFLQLLVYKNISWRYPIEQFGKITSQSNLLALFASGLYFFKPGHRFFKNNFLILLSTILLCFAGMGFWCLLFPLYYIDLGNLIVSSEEANASSAGFYAIWDHAVTQILFLCFFKNVNKNKDMSILIPVSKRVMMKSITSYIIAWICYNVFVSFCLDSFPTYGILTNFNPQNNLMIHETKFMLFNIRFIIIGHIMCCILAYILTWYFSLWAIKLRAVNEYFLLRRAKELMIID